MTENEISEQIVICAIEVHRTLGGPGLLESVYEEALAWELQNRSLLVERQVSVPIIEFIPIYYLDNKTEPDRSCRCGF